MALFSSQLSTKSLVPVCRQLSTSYGAGIPILRSLELVRGNTKNKRVQEVFADMNERIRNGGTLSDAARKQSQYLPPLLIELLAAGEVGGHLDVTLRELANYYEDRLAMRRLIIGKAAYPVFQLVVAWFLGTFALGLVRNLSFISRTFTLSGYLHSYMAFQGAALLCFGAAAVGCIILSRLGLFKWIWGWIATHLWPLSNVTLRFAQARFFRSFAMLIASGIPMHHAVQRAAATCANPYVERDLLAVIPAIKDGQTLVQAFAPSKYLSRTAHEMLYVGEESGKLDEALLKVAQYQMDEATHAVNVATRVGEIVIGLAVAAVVGYIVISFWSNYYGRMFDELRI
jgi:type IV pilus assembly protein PilC